MRETLERIIAIVWDRIAEKNAHGRTVTLKLKYNDFRTVTRSRSSVQPVTSREAFAATARALLEDELPLPRPIRLMGLTLGNLDGAQAKEKPRADGQLNLL